ncbi:hypothetical protein ACFQ12_17010, partial [Methylobacterium trifolii]
ALVTGEAGAGGFRIVDASEAGAPFVPGIRRVSIEAYIGRSGAGLNLGSGLPVTGMAGADVPRRGSVRAVLTTQASTDGRLTVERLRVEDRIAPTIEREPDRLRNPRFERERDHLDLRSLPGRGPEGIGQGGLGHGGLGQGGIGQGGLGQGGLGQGGLDTRPMPGGGGFGPGGPGGLGQGSLGGQGGFGGRR